MGIIVVVLELKWSLLIDLFIIYDLLYRLHHNSYYIVCSRCNMGKIKLKKKNYGAPYCVRCPFGSRWGLYTPTKRVFGFIVAAVKGILLLLLLTIWGNSTHKKKRFFVSNIFLVWDTFGFLCMVFLDELCILRGFYLGG